MKKTFVILALLTLASAALGQSVISKSFSDNVPSDGGTGVAISCSVATDGIDLSNAMAWQVMLSADAGRIFTGAGSALCNYYGTVFSSGSSGSTITRRWMRCPGTTFDVTPTAVRDVPSLDFDSPTGMGRICYTTSAIGTIQTDGGGGADGGLTITIEVRRAP